MRRDWGPVALITQVGLTIAVSIVLGLLLGLWIDSQLGTRPWFTLVLTLVGLVAGSFSVYRMLAAAIDAAAGEPDHSHTGEPDGPGSGRKENEE